MKTTAHGLTMDWSLCRNHFGHPVIHGYIDGEQRMSHRVSEETARHRDRLEQRVIGRLKDIADEHRRVADLTLARFGA